MLGVRSTEAMHREKSEKALPLRARSAASLFLYGGLVAWLTWPLLARMSTHLPATLEGCAYDLPMTISILAHQSRALVSAPWTFAAPTHYHPTADALFYGEAAFGALPLFLPVFLLTGNPVLASNLTFLAALALTGWAIHRVVARWTGSELGGLLSGCVFLSSRWVMWTWIPSVPNYAVLFYFPLIAYCAAAPLAGIRSTLVLAGLVALQGLSTIYLAIPMLIGLAVLGGYRALRAGSRRAGLNLLKAIALAAGVLFVANVGHAIVAARSPSGRLEGTFSYVRSFPMRLPADLLGPEGPMGLPLVVLLLIALGGWLSVARRRAHSSRVSSLWSHGALWSVVGLLTSPPPKLVVLGTTIDIGGLALLSWLPELRGSVRFGVVGLFGVAFLAGAAFADCVRAVRTASIAGRIASPALALVVLLSLYAQYTAGFAMPRALGFVPLPAAYDLAPAMRGDSGILTAIERAPDGPLLELPATRGPDSFPHPALNARAMQRAIYHRRPLLNGFTGFWPPGFRERMAQAARLPASDALESLRNETGLALVLVDLRELGRDAQIVCAVRHATQAERSACRASYAAEQRQAWLDAASPGARHDIKLLWRDGDDLLFGLVEHSPESSHR